jgi:ribosomal protein S18 acetylase RimI-like enzyme
MNTHSATSHVSDLAVTLRPVQLADSATLHAVCWPDYAFDRVNQLIKRARANHRNERGLGVVVTSNTNGAVIGFGQFTRWPRCGEISDLVIAPPYRSRGLGTVLIQHLVQTARQMGADCVEIGVSLDNPRALALYRRLGFQDDHTVQLDLGQGMEPVLYLRLSLVDHQ